MAVSLLWRHSVGYSHHTGTTTLAAPFVRFIPTYFNSGTDQSIVGITAYTQKGHIARATLEATCFQTKAILNAMEKDSGKKLAELAVDGGMCNSDLCMQVSSIVSFSLSWVMSKPFSDSGRSYIDPGRTSKNARDNSIGCRHRCRFCRGSLGNFWRIKEHQYRRQNWISS